MNSEEFAANVLAWSALGISMVIAFFGSFKALKADPTIVDNAPDFLKKKQGSEIVKLNSFSGVTDVLSKIQNLLGKSVSDLIPEASDTYGIRLGGEIREKNFKLFLVRPRNSPTEFLMGNVIETPTGAEIQAFSQSAFTFKGKKVIALVIILGIGLIFGMDIAYSVQFGGRLESFAVLTPLVALAIGYVVFAAVRQRDTHDADAIKAILARIINETGKQRDVKI